jgi:large subunit ribosomal protein L10Ae
MDIKTKINTEILLDRVEKVLAYAKEKGRKFTETVELQMSLKNYDPQKDKRFAGVFVLPTIPKEAYKVCVIADEKDIDRCKAAGITFETQKELTSFKKNKKLVKKFARKYDAFLASASLIRKIPRILGPGLNKAGKFPTSLAAADDITAKVVESKASVKIQLKSKKTLCVNVRIGNVDQDAEDIVRNVVLTVNYLASLLPKNWQQIKRVYVKSTMSPSHRVFGM